MTKNNLIIIFSLFSMAFITVCSGISSEETPAPEAAEGAGVSYPVTIELSDIPNQLRWGMTAFVDIEVGD